MAELEILLSNGQRVIWNTDATWTSSDKQSVVTDCNLNKPSIFAEQEHLALYAVNVRMRFRETKKPGLIFPIKEMWLMLI